jgi:ABC-type transporter Mla MlaB component
MEEFGTPLALVIAWRRTSQDTLRITFEETEHAMELRLEGRVAGPWAEELNRVWVEKAPQLVSKKLSIDLHNVTYADASGKQVLKAIYAQTNAQLVASTPWTQFLAAEVAANDAEGDEEETWNANNA